MKRFLSYFRDTAPPRFVSFDKLRMTNRYNPYSLLLITAIPNLVVFFHH